MKILLLLLLAAVAPFTDAEKTGSPMPS